MAQSTLQLSTAWDLLRVAKEEPWVVSMSSALDTLLGRGIPPGRVTEVSGIAGSGKTQLAFQLSINVQIPRCFAGGCGASAIYVDTEGSFSVRRLKGMTDAMIGHLKGIAETAEQRSAVSALSVESFLDHVLHCRCYDAVDLIAAVHRLEEECRANREIKLVIVDSIAQPFRGVEHSSERSAQISRTGSALVLLAQRLNIAVVVINQMTSRIASDGQSSVCVPALGQLWAKACSNRLELFRLQSAVVHEARVDGQTGLRSARLWKSTHVRTPADAVFRIAADGIRDFETE